MPRVRTFEAVASIGRTLSDVEVTTAWGQPALKVRGKMFACLAAHKSAEPNTLVVMMDIAGRDACIQDAPDTYYLKPHYVNYPCVLVRLARIRAAALQDVVTSAHRFMSGKGRAPSKARRGSTSPPRPAQGPLRPPGPRRAP